MLPTAGLTNQIVYACARSFHYRSCMDIVARDKFRFRRCKVWTVQSQRREHGHSGNTPQNLQRARVKLHSWSVVCCGSTDYGLFREWSDGCVVSYCFHCTRVTENYRRTVMLHCGVLRVIDGLPDAAGGADALCRSCQGQQCYIRVPFP